MTSAPDGGTVEVVRNHLVSVAEQMRRTLVRTAFNPVIYEVLDFGISVYDSQQRLMAEAVGITSFIGANDYAVPRLLDHVPPERLNPGDVLLLNYPYWNSAHAYDAMLLMPVHAPGSSGAPAPTSRCGRTGWISAPRSRATSWTPPTYTRKGCCSPAPALSRVGSSTTRSSS